MRSNNSNKWLRLCGICLIVFICSCGEDDHKCPECPQGDTTPPEIMITYPPDNATFSNIVTINVTAEATDNSAVEKVEYYIDGDLYLTDSTTPWAFGWRTITYLDNSEHTLYAKAYDRSGNSSLSSVVTVNIDHSLGDHIPPVTISDLMIADSSTYSVVIKWSAPGDDGHYGTANRYDIRYDSIYLTEDNWNLAQTFIMEPIPETSGVTQEYVISELNSDKLLYCAIKAVDEASNWSGISNVVVLPNTKNLFEDYLTISIGMTPSVVHSIDINNDLYNDIIIGLELNTDNILVLMNDGHGGFSEPVIYSVDVGPNYICHGDVNGDLRPDIITSNIGGHNLSILLNNSLGVYDSLINVEINGTYPMACVAVDFDLDGDLDLASANQGTNNVSVVLNSGGGTFQAPMNYGGVGMNPIALSSADLDGDGYCDLAVGNNSDIVTILKNNGDGTFQSPANYISENNAVELQCADLNGNGIIDIVVCGGNEPKISILYNQGSGTLSQPVHYTVGANPYDIAVDDFDGDGALDFAVANYGSDRITVLLNDGDGVFGYFGNFITDWRPNSITSADIDGDNMSDLIITNRLAQTLNAFKNISLQR